MRNKYVILGVMASALWGPALFGGQDPSTTTASGKIGLINIQQAIAQTGEGKQALEAIQKKYEPKRQELQRRQDEINALQDQIQKQGPTLSDEERGRLSRELDDKNRLFKRSQEDDQADFQADTQEAVQRIGQKMVRIIDDYAQKSGYELVIDPAGVQMPVYYVGKGVDITDPIVKLYDSANPVAAPAVSAPSASKTPASKPKQ
jgi:Skp family chaperone for outer membrane proteins